MKDGQPLEMMKKIKCYKWCGICQQMINNWTFFLLFMVSRTLISNIIWFYFLNPSPLTPIHTVWCHHSQLFFPDKSLILSGFLLLKEGQPNYKY